MIVSSHRILFAVSALRHRMGSTRVWFTAHALVWSCLLSGCGAEKESLFSHEHDAPDHWPTSLIDAADKIELRLNNHTAGEVDSVRDAANAMSEQDELELIDLVEWIPEVAADTDLTEAQWLPIYELCETMREHLARGDVGPFDIHEDFYKLQAILRDSAALLPKSTIGAAVAPSDTELEDASYTESIDAAAAEDNSGVQR